MQDRFDTLMAPSAFAGEAKETTYGSATFFYQDAINKKVPQIDTKQRYICTYRDGYYIYFVLSLNDEKDQDFNHMMSVVRSFKASELSLPSKGG